MKIDEAPDLLTIGQTADILQVDRRTVRRRIADGTLAAFKDGGEWRIPKAQIVQRIARALEDVADNA